VGRGLEQYDSHVCQVFDDSCPGVDESLAGSAHHAVEIAV